MPLNIENSAQMCSVEFINQANECLAAGWDYAALPKIKLVLILASIGILTLFLLDLWAIMRLKRLKQEIEALKKPEDVVERDEWGNITKK